MGGQTHMTCQEFLSAMQSRGAFFTPPVTTPQIARINTTLQQRKRAMIPAFLNELYTHVGGISLGSGCIFGPNEIPQGFRYPIPTLLQVNEDMSSVPKIFGKTIFGRNDLFWFAFDTFGTCYMLDNTTLSPLRKYDDPYRAMTDCLIAGKI